MTEIYIPLKTRQDKSLIVLLEMLGKGDNIPFAVLCKKIRKTTFYSLMARLKRYERIMQRFHGNTELLSVQKTRVAKYQFINYLRCHATISLVHLPPHETVAVVKIPNENNR